LHARTGEIYELLMCKLISVDLPNHH